MPANTSITLPLELALVAYLTPLCPFAESVVGSSDYRMDDEEKLSIVGEFITLPAVIVTVDDGTASMPEVPAVTAAVTVTVRHGIDTSSAATHQEDAVTACDALWDLETMEASLDAAAGLICSGVAHTAQGYKRVGRAHETQFQFEVEASCRQT